MRGVCCWSSGQYGKLVDEGKSFDSNIATADCSPSRYKHVLPLRNGIAHLRVEIFFGYFDDFFVLDAGNLLSIICCQVLRSKNKNRQNAPNRN